MTFPPEDLLDLVTLLGVGVCLLLLPVLGILRFLRYRKGSIDLVFDNRTYFRGDFIEGTVTLKARRALPVERLTLKFLGTVTHESVATVDSDHPRGELLNARWMKGPIIVLSEQITIAKGEVRTFPFRLQIPEFDRNVWEQFLNASKGVTVEDIGWSLIANAGVAGPDLETVRAVDVSYIRPEGI